MGAGDEHITVSCQLGDMLGAVILAQQLPPAPCPPSSTGNMDPSGSISFTPLSGSGLCDAVTMRPILFLVDMARTAAIDPHLHVPTKQRFSEQRRHARMHAKGRHRKGPGPEEGGLQLRSLGTKATRAIGRLDSDGEGRGRCQHCIDVHARARRAIAG